ncbi:hypothetical protein OsJ_04747 [Oryza sativa Japonica Group]|uniref:NAC domain-containing protein n=1 Tax=Oryza sativa subsp. japonica TaxID=39947 RepID=B9EWF6_ORYSJ|nr:hypothetical protein OsJ_04747 [Oryza sativa Japonica Group]
MGKEMNLIREDEYGGGGVGFEPTEDELMLHFLRPQLRGFAPRVAGAVVEADPCGAAPWELLARHGRREEGFFFSARARRKPSVRRTVAGCGGGGGGGGAWMHSSTRKGKSVKELGVVGAVVQDQLLLLRARRDGAAAEHRVDDGRVRDHPTRGATAAPTTARRTTSGFSAMSGRARGPKPPRSLQPSQHGGASPPPPPPRMSGLRDPADGGDHENKLEMLVELEQ